jgi:hypothetical protein
MLNFAEQTGSGAVIFVWSFLIFCEILLYLNPYMTFCFHSNNKNMATTSDIQGNFEISPLFGLDAFDLFNQCDHKQQLTK